VVNSDSELLTRQLRGEYKVKNENLKYFYEQFLHLSRGFNSIKIVTIRREENAAADKLANKAIDSRLDNSLKIE
jgi:ribonuclease HI